VPATHAVVVDSAAPAELVQFIRPRPPTSATLPPPWTLTATVYALALAAVDDPIATADR
jgi:hypothetical protein